MDSCTWSTHRRHTLPRYTYQACCRTRRLTGWLVSCRFCLWLRISWRAPRSDSWASEACSDPHRAEDTARGSWLATCRLGKLWSQTWCAECSICVWIGHVRIGRGKCAHNRVWWPARNSVRSWSKCCIGRLSLHEDFADSLAQGKAGILSHERRRHKDVCRPGELSGSQWSQLDFWLGLEAMSASPQKKSWQDWRVVTVSSPEKLWRRCALFAAR